MVGLCSGLVLLFLAMDEVSPKTRTCCLFAEGREVAGTARVVAMF